jgi:hypothetical protein
LRYSRGHVLAIKPGLEHGRVPAGTTVDVDEALHVRVVNLETVMTNLLTVPHAGAADLLGWGPVFGSSAHGHTDAAATWEVLQQECLPLQPLRAEASEFRPSASPITYDPSCGIELDHLIDDIISEATFKRCIAMEVTPCSASPSGDEALNTHPAANQWLSILEARQWNGLHRCQKASRTTR